MPVASLLLVLAIAWLIPWSAPGPGGRSSLEVAAPWVVAALVMAAAGAVLSVAWWDARAGRSALVAAVACTAAGMVAVEAVAPIGRGVALVVAPLAAPALAALAIALIRPAAPSVARPRPLLVLGGLIAAVSPLRAVVYRPFADLRCLDWCGESPLAVAPMGRPALVMQLAITGATTLLGAWLVATAVRRGRARSEMGGTSRSLAGAAALTGVALVAMGLASLGWFLGGSLGSMADPAPTTASRWLLAVAAGVLAGTGSLAALRAARRSDAVRRLTDALAPIPAGGGLAALLREAVVDPRLMVTYLDPGSERWIDEAGAIVPPPTGRLAPAPSPIHALTVERDGQVVAMIRSADPASGPAISAAMGPTARLLFDNERLRAALLARMAELRRARHEVVDAADAARRRLERDLHDGAQQRLLAPAWSCGAPPTSRSPRAIRSSPPGSAPSRVGCPVISRGCVASPAASIRRRSPPPGSWRPWRTSPPVRPWRSRCGRTPPIRPAVRAPTSWATVPSTRSSPQRRRQARRGWRCA
ncbi:MAG: hypothetical protein U0869_19570 [Chloroflexota bacterium]